MGFDVATREVPRVTTVYSDPVCDRCALPLEQVELAEEGTLQCDNALIVRLSGGYGMFCDPLKVSDDFDPEWDKIFCHECAHEVCDFLGIDASSWHSHD